MKTKNVGFIGPGKVGCSFGRYIAENGGAFTVAGYYGRDIDSAREAAAFAGGRAFESAEELAFGCGLLMLTVPDKLIESVWASLAVNLPDRNEPLYVGHCSGSQGSEVFSPKPGCHFGSIHPVLAVPDKLASYESFNKAYFTIEGDEAFASVAEVLLTELGNPFSSIDADQKIKYHAAAVMVSNLVCALTFEGMETFKDCGLDEKFADYAWRSLFLENAENIASLGPVQALTGPAERGDADTIARHLDALSGDAREIYLTLSRVLIETAQQKNLDRDYSELRNLLK